MSASLVGSEMCIRDRVRFATRFDWYPVRVSSSTSLHTERFVHNYGGEAPVSYTHLTLPTICSV
eukprot:4980513-Alexandrium_andersonii.AAC.1